MATKLARTRRHSISSIEEAKIVAETDSFATRQSRKRPLDSSECSNPAKKSATLSEVLSCTSGVNAAAEDLQFIAGGEECVLSLM